MTKYILHGGYATKRSTSNKKYYLEIVKGLEEPINVLVICFAAEKERWDEKFNKVKDHFSEIVNDKELEFILANKNIELLSKQIQEADVIYMIGGRSLKLLKKLSAVPNLTQLWKNKVVVGSSAGALVLAKYYHGNDSNTYNEGLGIFPFKIICHYSKNIDDRLEKLKQFGEDLEIKLIPEEKYIVIEK
ncbi:MAG: Type 1 glutamine amidotransferase-like domain-containing protein [bacterium]